MTVENMNAETYDLKAQVKTMIAAWNSSNNASVYRNQLRKLAEKRGRTVEDFIEMVFTPPTAVTNSLANIVYVINEDDHHYTKLAKQILSSEYNYQGMHNPEDARIWVMAQAELNRKTEDLPDSAQGFWRALETYFTRWKLMNVGVA